MLFQNSNSFKTGNYYEVVYVTLKKNIYEKDIEVTKILFECFPLFLKNLPTEVKVRKKNNKIIGNKTAYFFNYLKITEKIIDVQEYTFFSSRK